MRSSRVPLKSTIPKRPKPEVCTYDNPATFRREAYVNGKLLMDVSAFVLLERGFRGGRWFLLELNSGPWKTGMLVGSAAALPPDVRASLPGG